MNFNNENTKKRNKSFCSVRSKLRFLFINSELLMSFKFQKMQLRTLRFHPKWERLCQFPWFGHSLYVCYSPVTDTHIPAPTTLGNE